MLNLEQIVLDMGIQPRHFTQLQISMNELMSMLTKAGIRYNVSFQTMIQQLNAWMAEVAAAPRTANFGIFKATLEDRLAEIVNLLTQTKLNP
jgi:hypothetical protein